MGESANSTRIEWEGKQILVIGTAHVSTSSVEEVQEAIGRVRPDTVCVELDTMRYASLVNDDRSHLLDVKKLIAEDALFYVMLGLLLSGYQQKLGEKLGVRPGAELLAAVHAAREVPAQVVLADRDVQITLRRVLSRVTLKEKLRLLFGSVQDELGSGELTEETVEGLKQADKMQRLLAQLAKLLPGIKEPLIDERDLYLISSIREAKGPSIVAVVGAGHVPGMLANLNTPVDRQALCEIPRRSLRQKLTLWLIPTALALGSASLYGLGFEEVRAPLRAWLLPNLLLTALSALISGAHPLAAFAAALSAPLLGALPLARPGNLAARVQARLAPPSPAACKSANRDILSLRSLYRNRFTRLGWVALLTQAGARVGAWVGVVWFLWSL
jgi:pheromone shutdown-related protein TraB